MRYDWSMGRNASRGFTVVEIVTLALMMAVVAGLVLLLAPRHETHIHVDPKLEVDADKLARELMKAGREAEREMRDRPAGKFQAHKVECLNNQRNLVGLLIVASDKLPRHGGPNLLLYLVKKGELDGEDHLKLLFCPGDREESFELAGGVDGYKHLDLNSDANGHFTSYAARDQTDPKCRLKDFSKTRSLICDDSEDHHLGRGFVVAFSDGSARWRDKADDWEIAVETPVAPGKGSAVKELTCLVAD